MEKKTTTFLFPPHHYLFYAILLCQMDGKCKYPICLSVPLKRILRKCKEIASKLQYPSKRMRQSERKNEKEARSSVYMFVWIFINNDACSIYFDASSRFATKTISM